MNKAKYKISCIVWYLGKTGSGYGLRSSAVVSWTASNPNGERLLYRYQLADGSSKLESELAPTALIAVSRLLDPVKRYYSFSDHTIEYIAPTPEQIIEYLNDAGICYYVRESFAGIDFSTNGICFMRGKHFENCDFSGALINSIIDGSSEDKFFNFISCDFRGANIQSLNIKGSFDGSNFREAVVQFDTRHSSFLNCIFENARIDGSGMTGSVFSGSNFKNCNAINLKCNGSNFTGCIMDGIMMGDESGENQLTNSNFTRVSMKEAYLLKCNFKKSLLKNVDMSDAFLKGCDFTNAIGITNDQLYAFANKDSGEYTFTGVDGETITVP